MLILRSWTFFIATFWLFGFLLDWACSLHFTLFSTKRNILSTTNKPTYYPCPRHSKFILLYKISFEKFKLLLNSRAQRYDNNPDVMSTQVVAFYLSQITTEYLHFKFISLSNCHSKFCQHQWKIHLHLSCKLFSFSGSRRQNKIKLRMASCSHFFYFQWMLLLIISVAVFLFYYFSIIATLESYDFAVSLSSQWAKIDSFTISVNILPLLKINIMYKELMVQ